MINGIKPLERSLRWGMVGGGGTSQIGYIHRSAALRDGTFTLLAGAFDIDASRGRSFGQSLGVAAERCYPDYATLFREEAARADGIEAVSIATPNNTHFAICQAALEAGLHVVCEKPLCFTTQEAQALVELSQRQHKIIGVTYGYAGHQLILQARHMIADGQLGEIRIINMQSLTGSMPRRWNWTIPARVGGWTRVLSAPAMYWVISATHPLFLAETMVPQLKIKRLMCSRQSFVKTRAPLEDNAYVLMEYDNGAVGSMWCSAVNSGSMHGQKVRIVGKRPAWNGGTNSLTNCALKCRASRCVFWSVVCPTSILWHWRRIASAAVIPKGCSKPGRIFTGALRWRWTPPTGETRRFWPVFGTPTCMPARWGYAGWKTACAPPMPVPVGWRSANHFD